MGDWTMKISWTYSTYVGTTTSKKSSILHQKPQVRSLKKIQEMRETSLELTIDQVEDVEEVLETVVVLFFFLSFSNPFSL